MVISEQELSFSKYREFRDTLGFQKSLEMPPVAAISKQSAAIPGRSEKKKVFELQCNRVHLEKKNIFLSWKNSHSWRIRYIKSEFDNLTSRILLVNRTVMLGYFYQNENHKKHTSLMSEFSRLQNFAVLKPQNHKI